MECAPGFPKELPSSPLRHPGDRDPTNNAATAHENHKEAGAEGHALLVMGGGSGAGP